MAKAILLYISWQQNRNTVSLIKISDQLSGVGYNTVRTIEGSTLLATEEWVYK